MRGAPFGALRVSNHGADLGAGEQRLVARPHHPVLDPDYYRTYLEQDGQPKGFMSVQQEVMRALARPEDFRDVPSDDPNYRRKISGLQRDTSDNPTPAFAVRDRNYVSARWPADVHTFATTFAEMLS